MFTAKTVKLGLKYFFWINPSGRDKCIGKKTNKSQLQHVASLSGIFKENTELVGKKYDATLK